MAKKKAKGKGAQMLSPENYMRQRAGRLALHGCWINTDWQDGGTANILIARRHTTGNITAGIYMVDLKCVGVKETNFIFNIPTFEFQEILEDHQKHMEMEKVDYSLVHNVIYAGLEYAEELGLKPHPNFAITENLLEQDTDSIEFVEVECGVKGVPFFMRDPIDSDLFVSHVIEQLDKTVGPDNYAYVDQNLIDMFENHVAEQDENMDSGILPVFEEDEIADSYTLQLKIQIAGITRPPVWRRVLVPSYFRFENLHTLIQIVFEWADMHSYLFSPKGWGSHPVITDSSEDEFEPEGQFDAEAVVLSDVFKKENQKYCYIYDFGDDWKHEITLEKILPEITMYPSLLGGKGKCPPEDCGGVGGYENLKTIMANPNHEEHASMRMWLELDDDETWDPDEFDLMQIQEDLAFFYSPKE